MSGVEYVLLQDYEERYAPPAHPLLRLAYVNDSDGGTLFFNIVEMGDYDPDAKDNKLTQIASVAVSFKTFSNALKLLTESEGRLE